MTTYEIVSLLIALIGLIFLSSATARNDHFVLNANRNVVR